MTLMTLRTPSTLALALCLLAAPVAQAQTLPYGDTGDGAKSAERGESRKGPNRAGGSGVKVTPYIEAAQLVSAELSPGDDVLTYSRIAAGVDVSVAGRHTGASASVRVERYFGWNRGAQDGTVVSGLARGYATVVPGLQFEAGGLATRSRIDGGGSAVQGATGRDLTAGEIYSVYAGPTLGTQIGAVRVDGGYRIGYTRVEMPDALITAPGAVPVDVFDDSVAHNAGLRAGIRAGDVLPVGVGVGAGWNREDISNLDQRVDDRSVRGDVTVPVTRDLALVGGVGYEKLEVSSRDALRDGAGNPVIGSDGRLKTDKSAPRRIAYEAEGLIWDAGVLWRPSRRTALEAHVGKRYGSTTYYGSFAYAPSDRSAFNVSVYDTVSGFGGQVNRALAELPADFEANRDVLTGDLTGCVGSSEGGSCLSGALGSVRSSVFRSRGVSASWNQRIGRISAGIGAGHDRRKFLAAPGTVLAAANGVVDENTWLTAWMNTRVGARGTLTTNAYANWFQNGGGLNGDSTALGASTAYGHSLTSRLSATAALGIEGVLRDAPLDNFWQASGLVGLRYSF